MNYVYQKCFVFKSCCYKEISKQKSRKSHSEVSYFLTRFFPLSVGVNLKHWDYVITLTGMNWGAKHCMTHIV
jgi:hypothetical protein